MTKTHNFLSSKWLQTHVVNKSNGFTSHRTLLSSLFFISTTVSKVSRASFREGEEGCPWTRGRLRDGPLGIRAADFKMCTYIVVPRYPQGIGPRTPVDTKILEGSSSLNKTAYGALGSPHLWLGRADCAYIYKFNICCIKLINRYNNSS